MRPCHFCTFFPDVLFWSSTCMTGTMFPERMHDMARPWLRSARVPSYEDAWTPHA